MSATLYACGAAALAALAAAGERPPASGPLRIHPANPRYFADASGKAVLLVGSHTWNNLLDMGAADPPPRFDFDAYLDWMAKLNHNFIRLWAWELPSWDPSANNQSWSQRKRYFAAPQPWLRTGPGNALDGKPKFDLAKLNPEYFERLRTRVEAAGKRGIYVSIMLFEGWCMQFIADAWANHPFNPANNVNGVNGDPNGDGKGLEIHELAVKAVTAVQEAYVRKVIDTVNGLDNVLYEISNENHPPSTEWQYHIIRFIKDCEKSKPKQHPVGMTFQYKGGSNKTLFDSPADWVSPNPDGGYRDDPPPADGRKVVLNDTDHLWGIGGNAAWVWKSVTRGHNPLFMDPYDGLILGGRFEARFEPVRRNLGYALRLARRLDLAAMTPQGALASSKYCLAAPGKAYLVYAPDGGKVTVDLSAAKGSLGIEWLDPKTGKMEKAGAVQGGAPRELAAPFQGEAVLVLTATGP